MKQDLDSPVLVNENMVTGNSSLLGRPMMAMDGNLLSAFGTKELVYRTNWLIRKIY